MTIISHSISCKVRMNKRNIVYFSIEDDGTCLLHFVKMLFYITIVQVTATGFEPIPT